MEETRANFRNQEAAIRNLETQVGQIAKQLATTLPNAFPSDTQVNPRAECKAITLKSGRALDDVNTKELNQQKSDEEASKKLPKPAEKPAMQPNKEHNIPFPQQLRKEIKDNQFSKFLEIFKKLEINIPLAEALEQMPLYAKFLKDLISKKRNWREEKTVQLSNECNAVMHGNLPQKLKDPGSFHIPCKIGKFSIKKALCDLGSSINLMPLALMKLLEIEEVKETRMCIQLADKSVKHPYGVVENLLVKVGQFILPADFVILDMGPDCSPSIILGRPFLATGRTLIDVQKGELTFRVHKEQLVINVFEATQLPEEEDAEECMRIDVINKPAKEINKEEILKSKPHYEQTIAVSKYTTSDVVLPEKEAEKVQKN